MALNSCLYATTISHRRLKPVEHAFAYKFFSFYIDLDELDALAKMPLIGRNRPNFYAFYDSDHMDIKAYLKANGIDLQGGRTMLLTYLRVCGYVFNPVSFYFCFNAAGEPVCVVPEIGNTFGEIKPFLVDTLNNGAFEDTQDKFYYISPFMKLDDQLDYRITIPSDRLDIRIDTSRDGEKLMLAAVSGRRMELNTWNLFKLSCQFPLVTLKVITLIHWHAFLLWLKRVPFEAKENNPHLQKEVLRAWHTSR